MKNITNERFLAASWIVAILIMVISLALSVTVRPAQAADECPQNWIGVPCNTTVNPPVCNYNWMDSNVAGCDCDLNNVCQDAGR